MRCSARPLHTAPSWGEPRRDNVASVTAGPPATWPYKGPNPAPPGPGLGATRPEKGDHGHGTGTGLLRHPQASARALRSPGRSSLSSGVRPRTAVTCAAGGCCVRSVARRPAVRTATPDPGTGCAGDGGMGRGLGCPLQASKAQVWGALRQPQRGRRRGAARPWRAVPGAELGPGSGTGSCSPKWRPAPLAASRIARGTGAPSARRRGSREMQRQTRRPRPSPLARPRARKRTGGAVAVLSRGWAVSARSVRARGLLRGPPAAAGTERCQLRPGRPWLSESAVPSAVPDDPLSESG